jgi:hypothetical protein
VTRYLLGCDLGQMSDFTALAVVEEAPDPDGGPDPARHCRHLERVRGVSYVAIAERVRDLVAALREPVVVAERVPVERSSGRYRTVETRVRPTVEVVLDRTGVGAAAHDVMAAAGIDAKLVPVVIHGGEKVTREGGIWRCPKRDLVAAVAVGLQGGRFKIAEALALREVLTSELGNFRLKHTAAGHDQYEAWREDEHDDLVLAVALPLWWAERGKPRRVPPPTGVGRASAWTGGRERAAYDLPIGRRGF